MGFSHFLVISKSFKSKHVKTQKGQQTQAQRIKGLSSAPSQNRGSNSKNWRADNQNQPLQQTTTQTAVPQVDQNQNLQTPKKLILGASQYKVLRTTFKFEIFTSILLAGALQSFKVLGNLKKV